MTKHYLQVLSLFCFSFTAFAQNNYKERSLLQLMQRVKQTDKGYIILDVRTSGEYADTGNTGKHIGIGRIKNAINIPVQELLKPDALKQLDKYRNEEIYVICSHSYRSRRISNLLLQNGFADVTNIQGGMTEWFRNYQQLAPYMNDYYETSIPYRNIAPEQLFKMLTANEPVELIGFCNPPRFPFDSLVAPMYAVFPDFKNAAYHKPADSLVIWQKVKSAPEKTFVFFNTVGGGGAETAEWLSRKGFQNTPYLVNNLTGFFEYIVNYQPGSFKKLMKEKSRIEYFTPLSFCNNTPSNYQWVDIRHDTTFNQMTKGTKLEYKTLKGAVNFPFYKSAEEFAGQFPDKSKLYVLIPQNGYTGLELAEVLLQRGYRIGWLLSGIERWEWYSNNIPEFSCKDYFVK